jgi:hypothetical protein
VRLGCGVLNLAEETIHGVVALTRPTRWVLGVVADLRHVRLVDHHGKDA